MRAIPQDPEQPFPRNTQKLQRKQKKKNLEDKPGN